MTASSGLFLATIYNQSQLAERNHVAHYCSIDTAAMAVPLSPLPSAITKLAAILGGGYSEEMFCRPCTGFFLIDQLTMSPPLRPCQPSGAIGRHTYSAAVTTLSDTARTYSDYNGPRGGVAA